MPSRLRGGNGVTDVKRDGHGCRRDVSRDTPAEHTGENAKHLDYELLGELMIPPTVVNALHPSALLGVELEGVMHFA
jgi:hypothetical protein